MAESRLLFELLLKRVILDTSSGTINELWTPKLFSNFQYFTSLFYRIIIIIIILHWVLVFPVLYRSIVRHYCMHYPVSSLHETDHIDLFHQIWFHEVEFRFIENLGRWKYPFDTWRTQVDCCYREYTYIQCILRDIYQVNTWYMHQLFTWSLYC